MSGAPQRQTPSSASWHDRGWRLHQLFKLQRWDAHQNPFVTGQKNNNNIWFVSLMWIGTICIHSCMKNDFVVVMDVMDMLQLQLVVIETIPAWTPFFWPLSGTMLWLVLKFRTLVCKNFYLSDFKGNNFPFVSVLCKPKQSSVDVEFEQETEIKDILKTTFGRCFRILPVASLVLRMCNSLQLLSSAPEKLCAWLRNLLINTFENMLNFFWVHSVGYLICCFPVSDTFMMIAETQKEKENGRAN